MAVVEQICNKVAVMADGVIQESGTVRDVFLRPQSETAKKLFEPDSEDKTVPPNAVRLAFTGEDSGDPVISDMAIKCGAMVNILSANTENIGGKTFGQMVIQLSDDAAEQQKVFAYLDARGVLYEKLEGSAQAGAPSQTVEEAQE
jgi:D-methionine transport system ATP-binding protein